MGDSEQTMAQTVLIGEANRLSARLDEIARAPAQGACPDHRIVVEAQALSLKMLTAIMSGNDPSLPWGRITAAGGTAGTLIVVAWEIIAKHFALLQ